MNSYPSEGLPHEVAVPLSGIKGRGAATRMAHRFQSEQRDPFDDGWEQGPDAREAGDARPVTEITWEDA